MSLPILLIPGLNCTPEIWAGQINTLWRFGPVTIANHTRGDSMAEIATQILAEAPPRFVLAGISMGGYLSFELWRQAPERIAGIGFVDTSARPDAPEATARRRDAMTLAGQGKFAQVIASAFPFAVHEAHAERADLRAIHTRMSLENGVPTYLRQQEAIIARPDSRPTLTTISVPALVVVGAGDRLTPPELSAEIASGITGARLETIADAGHMSLVEQPEAVNAVLADWLAGLVG